jgi:hypothetical protein
LEEPRLSPVLQQSKLLLISYKGIYAPLYSVLCTFKNHQAPGINVPDKG